jgi:hypothetical protein
MTQRERKIQTRRRQEGRGIFLAYYIKITEIYLHASITE